MTTDTKHRRSYTEDFKRDAVALVTEQGYTVTEAARSLGINSNQLHRWKRLFAEEAAGTRLSDDEREELKRLRKEVRELRMEKDILKNPRRHNFPARRNRNSGGLRYTGRVPKGAAVSFLVDYPVKKRGPGTVADPIVVTLSSDPG